MTTERVFEMGDFERTSDRPELPPSSCRIVVGEVVQLLEGTEGADKFLGDHILALGRWQEMSEKFPLLGTDYAAYYEFETMRISKKAEIYDLGLTDRVQSLQKDLQEAAGVSDLVAERVARQITDHINGQPTYIDRSK